MPKTAADLAPVLKQAVTQSGMFYEAHQARWVAGELPTEALRQEPQGKYPATQIATIAHEQSTPKLAGLATPDSSVHSNQAISSPSEMSVSNPVPRDLAPLVQQQLDGLANQNFAWQGQSGRDNRCVGKLARIWMTTAPRVATKRNAGRLVSSYRSPCWAI